MVDYYIEETASEAIIWYFGADIYIYIFLELYWLKHFLILPLLIYIFHVTILVLDIIKASKSFVLFVYLYDFHPFQFHGELG